MVEEQPNKVYNINENDFIFTTKQEDILADDSNTKKSEVCFFSSFFLFY